MTSDNDLMMQSLELAAERCEDISPLVYETFFALAPDARALFNMDRLSKGRMLNESLSLLLDQADGRSYVATVADTFQRDHLSYGAITAAHYRIFFEALLATLRTLLADSWSDAHEAAWSRQVGQLTRLFQPVSG